MTYWDSSALVALLIEEKRTAFAMSKLADDPAVITWWLSRVECVSALMRLRREHTLDDSGVRDALAALDALSSSWIEVQPAALLRNDAVRLLRVHPLRAADAMQLASAVSVTGHDRRAVSFVSFDAKLLDAAEKEGFAAVTIR